MSEDLPVFEVAPGLARRPFLPLSRRPTPVESLAALSGGRFSDRLWVKREDLVSDRYGGNKVRRWEWILGLARSRGIDEVITVGGLGSTQMTSLCAHGVAQGFSVTGVLFDQPSTPFVDEALALDERFGGRAIRAGGYLSTAIATLRAKRRRKRAMLIPPGASGALANIAYVDAMLELGAQVARGEAPRPDRILVACGSGGTTVGLAIGVALLGWPTRVVGVRITDLVVSNPLTLGALSHVTTRLLEREGLSSARAARLHPRPLMEHRFVGKGYGYSTPAAEEGARVFEELFGVPGEVTYSGKAFAALATIASENPRETILLVNTLSTTGRAR